MTLSVRERAWFKTLAIGAAASVAIVAAAWLAGAFFLAASGAAPAQTASPITLYSYWYWYSDNPKIEAWLYISVLVGVLALVLPIAPVLLPRKPSLHGDARWSRASEIRRAGLLKGTGIIVGEWRGRLLTHGGTPMISPHAYLAAPTGSGKTQGVMLPNALSWPGSMVALDIKGELYSGSAGYRAAHGQKVFRLNFTPRDYRTHFYNCFAFVSTDPNFLVADVQRITNYLIQLGKGDDFWPLQGRQLFIGLALYFFSMGEIPTLPKIRALTLVGGDGMGLQRWCKSLMSDPAKMARLHPEARMSLTSFATSAENTASGIAQTVAAGLTPFLNDLTAAVVSDNSFDLRKLREEAMSIYIVVHPSDLEQLSPVLRLLFQQIVDLNTDVEFGKSERHRYLVLLGMDEFANIGKVPAIEKGISYIRSYGLRLLALFQSPAQLTAVYSNDGAKAFSDNFGCAIFYTPAPQDVSGAKHISEVLGYQTVSGKSKSKRGTWGWDDKSRSETTTDQRRALMLPQEILRMSPRESIVVMSGTHPIKARKPFAAHDARFSKRMCIAPEVPLITIQPPAAPAAAKDTRPIVTEDVVELKELDLSDLSLDFSDVELPKEPVSEAEIEHLCSKVYERVMMPAGAVAQIQ